MWKGFEDRNNGSLVVIWPDVPPVRKLWQQCGGWFTPRHSSARVLTVSLFLHHNVWTSLSVHKFGGRGRGFPQAAMWWSHTIIRGWGLISVNLVLSSGHRGFINLCINTQHCDGQKMAFSIVLCWHIHWQKPSLSFTNLQLILRILVFFVSCSGKRNSPITTEHS
jgi:hypothetical protein